MIYLDNSATTRPCSEAVEAMTKALTENWGNPSALYDFGIRAARELRTARHAVAPARAAGIHHHEIGTGDLGVGQIALYDRCGFVRCGVDVDYFSKHYPVPFFENGVECRHMVRLRMELK